jgi:hypothetical protein
MNRYEKIAANVVAWGIGIGKMPREFYIPRGENVINLQKINPEGTDLEIYTYEDSKGVPHAMAFAGKQSKPLWHYWFHSEDGRQRKIDDAIRDRKKHIEFKEKQRQERLQYRHGLKVGDILYSSWGYDQTNVDFYQVTAVVGDKRVKIRPIAKKAVSYGGPGGNRVVPVPNRFAGPEQTKIVGVGDCVKVSSFAWAHKWDGRPLYETDPMFGH